MEQSYNSGKLKIDEREIIRMYSLRSEIEVIPTNESKFVEEIISEK